MAGKASKDANGTLRIARAKPKPTFIRGDRVHVSVYYRPPKGVRRKYSSETITVVGTHKPEDVIEVLRKAIENQAAPVG